LNKINFFSLYSYILIVFSEHCSQPPPPPQPPIVIRQIPPRPSTPPPLIIRERPPPMPDLQEPTIIEREVPLPSPPPRQVIVEQFPTPPPKPRSIIFEKWLPYEEPADRPCIVEKVASSGMPPVKNVIIQYEAVEPKIQPQCINEGISYVDPKQFVNDKPNGNFEVYYVDQLNNLVSILLFSFLLNKIKLSVFLLKIESFISNLTFQPDHIKCQLSPQVLAAIGIQNNNKQNTSNNPYVGRTNSSAFRQQNDCVPGSSISPMPPQHSMMVNGYHSSKASYSQLGNPNMCRQKQQQGNRALSASAAGVPRCYNKYNMNMLAGNQGLNNLARVHYNPVC
jgi:hypothetical protein